MATNMTGSSPKQLKVIIVKSSVSSSLGLSGLSFYSVNGNKNVTPA